MASRIGGLVLSIAIASIASIPALASARTTVVFFRPWTQGALSAGFTISKRLKGSCGEHSLTTDRPDAWRCFQGDEIYDPCFSGTSSTRVVACAFDPFSKV